jgi:hypothetical protein
MKLLPPAPRPADPNRDTCCPSCGSWFRGKRGLSLHLYQFTWCRICVCEAAA